MGVRRGKLISQIHFKNWVKLLIYLKKKKPNQLAVFDALEAISHISYIGIIIVVLLVDDIEAGKLLNSCSRPTCGVRFQMAFE